MLSRKVLYAVEFVSRLVADDFGRPCIVRPDMFACLFYRESPGPVLNSFKAAGFKPRGQP